MKRKQIKYKMEVRIRSRFKDEFVFRKIYFKSKNDMIKGKDKMVHKFYHDDTYYDFKYYNIDYINRVNEQLTIFYVYN